MSHDGGTGADKSGPRGSAAGRGGCGEECRPARHQENSPQEEGGGSPISARSSRVQGARHSTTGLSPPAGREGASSEAHMPAVASVPRWEPDRSLACNDRVQGGTERRAHDRTGGLTLLCQGIQMAPHPSDGWVPQLEGATPKPHDLQNAGMLCGRLPLCPCRPAASPRYRLLGGCSPCQGAATVPSHL